LQVGTTSSTAVDPLLALGKIAKVTYLTELMRKPTKRSALFSSTNLIDDLSCCPLLVFYNSSINKNYLEKAKGGKTR
jgi:hypothetical protein